MQFSTIQNPLDTTNTKLTLQDLEIETDNPYITTTKPTKAVTTTLYQQPPKKVARWKQAVLRLSQTKNTAPTTIPNQKQNRSKSKQTKICQEIQQENKLIGSTGVNDKWGSNCQQQKLQGSGANGNNIVKKSCHKKTQSMYVTATSGGDGQKSVWQQQQQSVVKSAVQRCKESSKQITLPTKSSQTVPSQTTLGQKSGKIQSSQIIKEKCNTRKKEHFDSDSNKGQQNQSKSQNKGDQINSQQMQNDNDFEFNQIQSSSKLSQNQWYATQPSINHYQSMDNNKIYSQKVYNQQNLQTVTSSLHYNSLKLSRQSTSSLKHQQGGISPNILQETLPSFRAVKENKVEAVIKSKKVVIVPEKVQSVAKTVINRESMVSMKSSKIGKQELNGNQVQNTSKKCTLQSKKQHTKSNSTQIVMAKQVQAKKPSIYTTSEVKPKKEEVRKSQLFNSTKSFQLKSQTQRTQSQTKNNAIPVNRQSQLLSQANKKQIKPSDSNSKIKRKSTLTKKINIEVLDCPFKLAQTVRVDQNDLKKQCELLDIETNNNIAYNYEPSQTTTTQNNRLNPIYSQSPIHSQFKHFNKLNLPQNIQQRSTLSTKQNQTNLKKQMKSTTSLLLPCSSQASIKHHCGEQVNGLVNHSELSASLNTPFKKRQSLNYHQAIKQLSVMDDLEVCSSSNTSQHLVFGMTSTQVLKDKTQQNALLNTSLGSNDLMTFDINNTCLSSTKKPQIVGGILGKTLNDSSLSSSVNLNNKQQIALQPNFTKEYLSTNEEIPCEESPFLISSKILEL